MLVAPLGAQTPEDTMQIIAEREFTDTAQVVRVTLFKSIVYKLELSRPNVAPRFTPTRRGTYPPTALQIQAVGPLGGPVFEVHIDQDGEYDLGVNGTGGASAVRVRLQTDPRTTRNRQIKQDTPDWRIGLRAEFGIHSGYLTAATSIEPESGTSYGGCVVVAYGGKASLCLGGGSDSRGNEDSRVAWIFGEVQVLILTLNSSPRRPTMIGALARIANGNSKGTVSGDASLLAAGVYVQQWLSHSPNGRGLSAILSGSIGNIGNSPADSPTRKALTISLQWLP
jgi:hypothetical protein